MNRTPIAEHQNAWPPAELDDDAPVEEALRTAFLVAFEALGGAKGLADWAQANPTQFYRLYFHMLSRAAPAAPVYADVSDTPVSYEPLSEDAWKERFKVSAAGRDPDASPLHEVGPSVW
jgi:hypothetical protein